LSRQERIKEYEARYNEWKEEKTTLICQNERVKNVMTAKHAEEVRKVKTELEAKRGKANTLNKRPDRLTVEVSLIEKKLAICYKRLKEWGCYTSCLSI
jgi:chromosome segregation ATPase